jgi:hypothetical protein
VYIPLTLVDDGLTIFSTKSNPPLLNESPLNLQASLDAELLAEEIYLRKESALSKLAVCLTIALQAQQP